MRLRSRLRKIEARVKPAEPCSECGIRPGDHPRWVLGGEQDPDEPLVEYCRGCGRVLRFSLDIGDAPLDR